MNTLEIKADWSITKAKLKRMWPRLTEEDLQFVEGQHDALVDRIQRRTGETHERVKSGILESFSCSG
jgi:uncharacterized protein YjbJ (UPF0337 family)